MTTKDSENKDSENKESEKKSPKEVNKKSKKEVLAPNAVEAHQGENYKAEIETLDEVTLKATLNVDSKLLDSKYKSQLNLAKNQANLKGFRPGKAPIAMVEKLYKPNILKQISDELMQESTLDLIKAKDFQVVGYPEVDIKKLEVGENFEFSIKIALYPNPTIADYDKFDVKVVKSEITDDAVEQEINLILESNANEVDCSDEALGEEHEFEGLVRVSVGEEVDESQNFEPLKSSLTANQTLPKEFLEEIKGAVAPSEVSKLIDVPSDFKNESLAGKKCFYEFQLKKVTKKDLPKLTDEFVEKLESHDAKTVTELKKLVKEIKEEEESKRADEQVYDKILTQVVERNAFRVPQPMIDEEIKNMFASYGFFQNSQMNAENFNVAPFRDNFNPQAEKRIQTSIAIDSIVEQEKIEASDDDIEKHIQKLADSSGYPIEDIKKHYSGDNQKMLVTEIKRDKVLEILKSRATVSYIDKPEETEEEQTKDVEAQASA